MRGLQSSTWGWVSMRQICLAKSDCVASCELWVGFSGEQDWSFASRMCFNPLSWTILGVASVSWVSCLRLPELPLEPLDEPVQIIDRELRLLPSPRITDGGLSFYRGTCVALAVGERHQQTVANRSATRAGAHKPASAGVWWGYETGVTAVGSSTPMAPKVFHHGKALLSSFLSDK